LTPAALSTISDLVFGPFDAPGFIFALAQPAAAPWLKEELKERHPELRFAFSRPGLYTFKATTLIDPEFQLNSVFARHWGFSLGAAATTRELVETLPKPHGDDTERIRLFVSARDATDNTEVANSALDSSRALADKRAAAVRAEVLTLTGDRFHPSPTPATGDWVLDVILGGEDEPYFMGYHKHSAAHGRVPGGVQRASAPSGAPSRAYCKLQEALAWSELPVREGDCAVEIGCAPGGAVAALLERGVKVTGIDPADMAPELEEHAASGNFVHLKCAAGAVSRSDLPRRAQWLLCDANLAPQVALRYITQIAKMLRPHLRGIVFTLKLNDESVLSALPGVLESFGRLGKGSPRAIQLPSHRREIVAVVLV
jgi:23S rRNA (cytidine2498-2'-O)-methyltransferase